MTTRIGIPLALMCFVVPAVMAQTKTTKISGVARCEKPDPQYTLAIDDMANHSFTISRTKCTWTKPYEIEGIGARSCFITGFSELSGNASRYRSHFTDTMANGDKIYYGAEGTVTYKDGAFQSADEKWNLLRGTGKMQGIKAHGTCDANSNPDGSTSWTCQGEYELTQ